MKFSWILPAFAFCLVTEPASEKNHSIYRMRLLEMWDRRNLVCPQHLEKYHIQHFRLTVITRRWLGGMKAQRSIRTCVFQILKYTLSFKKFFNWFSDFVTLPKFLLSLALLLTTCWYDRICCFICNSWDAIDSQKSEKYHLSFQKLWFPAWVCLHSFSATLKYQDHNLLRNKSSWINFS